MKGTDSHVLIQLWDLAGRRPPPGELKRESAGLEAVWLKAVDLVAALPHPTRRLQRRVRRRSGFCLCYAARIPELHAELTAIFTSLGVWLCLSLHTSTCQYAANNNRCAAATASRPSIPTLLKLQWLSVMIYTPCCLLSHTHTEKAGEVFK